MRINKKLGSIGSFDLPGKTVDYLSLQWHECSKRVMVKKTVSGRELSLQFLNEQPAFTEGDVLYVDDNNLVVVQVEPCECIVVTPANPFEMASAAYEIGNKHLPLFYENDQLLVPFEMPLFQLLKVYGYRVETQHRKLLVPLKTTVAPHSISLDKKLFAV